MDQNAITRRKLSITLLLICFFTIHATGQNINNEKDFQRLKDVLDGYADDLNLPSYCAYVSYGSDFDGSWAYGYANIEDSLKATENTCYQCASLTKSLAATVIMQLAEQGTIDLDEPVLPYIRNIVEQYGIPIDEKVGAICVDHLLSHTSDDPAGTYFRYDGDRYSLLTKIIYEKSGFTFDQLLKDRIIDPLGLTHTIPGTQIGHYPEILQLLAEPYDIDKNMQKVPGKYTSNFNTSAGLVSNVNDLGIFLKSYMNNSLLSQQSLQTQLEPFMLNNGCRSVYGLGWYVEECYGTRVVWNYGYGYSTSGLMMLLPDYDAVFVILSNCDMLSRPFSIGLPEVSVLESPFANAFIRTVRKTGLKNIDYPEINWFGSENEISKKIGQCEDLFFRASFLAELTALWNIAQCKNDKKSQDKLMGIYDGMITYQKVRISSAEPIAAIRKVNSKGVFRDTVYIDQEGLYRLRAIADGGYLDYFGMYDKVSLKNVASDEEIWQMKASRTVIAGGHPRNRLADLVLPLDTGTYELIFDNTGSPYDHFEGHWEAFPPLPDHFGFSLYKTP